MSKEIKKILIANRGEIAVRIMKSCAEMGIKSVAVYSEIDSRAMHVRHADFAYCAGPAPAIQSYLNQDKIIEIATSSKCDAIHPGYGFLSENPEFAKKVTENGLIFVGPTAENMKLMGDKSSARSFVRKLGVRVVPGSEEPVRGSADASRIAEEIGYPVLIKASGGGGGKGMRAVRSEDELPQALRASRSEALSAFDDDRVYIEKYIENPRHIEVPVMADSHGNILHLGERECSIQRRHQKVIEEAPSTYLNEKQRGDLTQAAVKILRSANYLNAGTVEFIFDSQKQFYFLEMNTRLQVEHPVTEQRIGLDLVREQIRIANGEVLPISQEDLKFEGHSVECRIYAEDPYNNFFPSTGEIVSLKFPSGLGIRTDSGTEEGDSVTPFYDPLLAKLITFGVDREDALVKMGAALEKSLFVGVKNNIRFCHWIITHPKFISGEYDTGFIEKYFKSGEFQTAPDKIVHLAALAALIKYGRSEKGEIHTGGEGKASYWKKNRESNLR